MTSFRHGKVTGFSGNEIFCLDLVGYRPGRLCLGNAVVALGVLRGLGAGVSTLVGGEVAAITAIVRDGRRAAIDRLLREARDHGGNLEFVALGSAVAPDAARAAASPEEARPPADFSAAAGGRELFCQLDAGFSPRAFVFGNVAYAIGVGGNLLGGLRSLARGEVPQYTEIFDRTRRLALARLVDEAKAAGANAVVGVRISILPLLGAQEMLMLGTAARHPLLEAHAAEPVTSDLRDDELWSLVAMGYLPLRLVMGVSVYALGLFGGIGSGLRSLVGGSVETLAEQLYEAREKAFERIQRDAEACGADLVVGVTTRVYDLGGGLVEVMAVGTAVRRAPGAATRSAALPPQAIAVDRETFVEGGLVRASATGAGAASSGRRGPLAAIASVALVVLYLVAKIYALTR